jgi:hypothetical protein
LWGVDLTRYSFAAAGIPGLLDGRRPAGVRRGGR